MGKASAVTQNSRFSHIDGQNQRKCSLQLHDMKYHDRAYASECDYVYENLNDLAIVISETEMPNI